MVSELTYNIFKRSEVYFDSRYNIYRSKYLIDLDSKNTWDRHWIKRGSPNTMFEKFARFYRKIFISRLVSKYCDKYFKESGIFLEAGSGTAEASFRIPKRKRVFIACDISIYPLLRIKNKNIDVRLQADIFKLPILDESIDGIYNIGVMEHFTFEENIKILKEFKRILKPDGVIVLFWPWKYCWVELISKIKPLFPSSPSMFGTFDFNELLSEAGLYKIWEGLSMLDGFIHKVIVLKKA